MKSNTLKNAVRTTRVLFRLVTHQPEQYLHIHGMLYYKVSKKFLSRINLSNKEASTIHLAIILHDIGKLGVPGKILWSRDALTDEEYRIVKQHSLFGYYTVKSLGYSESVAQVVRQHHERLDGSGYPDGLHDYEISKLAKAVGILDSYDVMRRGRVYKKAMSNDEIIQVFEEAKNTKFDSKMVDTLIECIKESEQ